MHQSAVLGGKRPHSTSASPAPPFEKPKASERASHQQAERHVNGDVEMSSQISGRHPERDLSDRQARAFLKDQTITSESSPNSRRYGKAPSDSRVCVCLDLRASVRPWNITYQQGGGRARAQHLIVRLPKYPAFR